jgi:membrane-bound metal-dependent hydrolase YbcI (DUF457 family)
MKLFIGHWAPAFLAATNPKAPKLGTLFAAGQLVDLAFFSFVIVDVEHMRLRPGISVMNPMDLYDMPYTHSLAAAAVWALVFGLAILVWQRSRSAAIFGGLVVLSHWFLDLLVHVPDLTLWGQPPKLGLGLWSFPAIAIPLELGLTFGAAYIFFRKTKPVSKSSGLAMALLMLGLMIIQAVNWFGPPPSGDPSRTAPMVLGIYLAMILLALWVGGTRKIS